LKKINPVILLVFFSVLVFILRRTFYPEFSDESLVAALEQFLGSFGVASIVTLFVLYFFCSFFFIPILIPLNIACGALYGPILGALAALAGVLISCFASTVSVRYVFRGMGNFAMRHPEIKNYLVDISRRGSVMVIIVRLAFVVPYLFQNIVLALTQLNLGKLMLLTIPGAVPGVLSYSYLGAGLVSLEATQSFVFYLSVPLLMLVGITFMIRYLRDRIENVGQDDH